MDERVNYEFPPIPGVHGEIIREEDVDRVLIEIHRLVLDEENNNMGNIARIFDASPDSIQDNIRKTLKGTMYETY